MADQNVPPRRSRDDSPWDGRPQPGADGYRAAPGGPSYSRPAPGSDGYPDARYPRSAGHPQYSGYSQPAAQWAHQQSGQQVDQWTEEHRAGGRRGPQWVGPEGLEPEDRHSYAVPGELPELEDDDEGPGRSNGRRRALIALTGAAAVVAGAGAIAVASRGTGLADKILGHTPFGGDGGNATAAAITDGTADRPSGQQPSTVRTYTEQNESYMGSKAGQELKKNSPAGGRTLGGPGIAAAQTEVTVKTVLAKDPIRHLATRATFGATPKLLTEIKTLGIDEWLRRQLDPDKIAPTRAELKLSELPTLNMSIKQLRERRDTVKNVDNADEEFIWATIARQIWSDRQLYEVMVDFWNDFLHVAAYFDGGDIQRASFDRDVIRKHALGNYADMLVAANTHPALLTYLNQSQSHKDAINENLARENLELYSVGVDGGYTEMDVRQAAMLQTGLGVDKDEYVYRANRHYVGKVSILGFTSANSSAEDGEAVIKAYLRHLALHPSTANYVAQSLATRFVSDTPPKALVERLAKTYSANKGAIKPTLMTLFSSTEFWGSVGQKVRRPMEYLVATYRVLGMQPDPSPDYKKRDDLRRTPFADGLSQLKNKMEDMGQFPAGLSTPNGYPDVYVAWTSAGTMVAGWNEAHDVINGNRKVFSYTAPEKLVAAPPATAGAYLDVLAQRLVHQKLTDKEKNLILGIAGVTAATKVDATFNGAITAVARALLASPQHHLR
ncbi:uncharacterized protein (DUF1800 family) [Micromonospora pisi]|uniref:Uncharacterized protein (DUF1800 family) n=1 Tax=Micromonospora pisi TaxID=589240 RepID=A0A495JGB3_9ACTN|nr:DUF1800 domain-containing protein [Micromonospora pisi]RKR87414.1 uncharacterized protein (DUF1800 family) [Micromonospora pisi]